MSSLLTFCFQYIRCQGIIIYFISDDAPTGNYKELIKHGAMSEVSAAASFRSGAVNFNTWLLFIQYACCFGVGKYLNMRCCSLYLSFEPSRC